MTKPKTPPAKGQRRAAKPKPKAQPNPPGHADEGLGQRRPTMDDIEPILLLIEDGQSIRGACRKLGINHRHASALFRSDEELWGQYARAQELRADLLAEEALVLGLAAARKKDGVVPDGARVAVDVIKWMTGRMAPRTAPSEKIDVNVKVQSMTEAEIDARIAELLALEARQKASRNAAEPL